MLRLWMPTKGWCIPGRAPKRMRNGGVTVERSRLTPFLREGLDILFVGLNPATGSSRNGHYFSVNSAFWNQLFDSGLILRPVSRARADEIVFGSNAINCRGWQYGITDLVTAWSESDSSAVAPLRAECERLVREIAELSPRAVVVLHGKVRRSLARFLSKPDPKDGHAGRWLSTSSVFYFVPFPHGNAVCSEVKVGLYRQVREHLMLG